MRSDRPGHRAASALSMRHDCPPVSLLRPSIRSSASRRWLMSIDVAQERRQVLFRDIHIVPECHQGTEEGLSVLARIATAAPRSQPRKVL
jgi:hypothetical protein